LSRLPDEIGDLKNLKVLNVRDNELRDLPDSLAQLSKLTNLIIRANRFTSVPAVLARLPAKVTVDLRGNDIPPQAIAELQAARPDLVIQSGPE
jgi:Leucine-rich repeat (LRR) protein